MVNKNHIRAFKYALGALLVGYGMLALAAFIWNAYDTHQDIKDGRLVYEKHLGWLDLTHATTSGATSLLQAICIYDAAGTRTYQQCMGYFNVRGCTHITFSLKDTLYDDPALFATTEYIYRKTSLAFEEMQGKVPLLFFDLPFSSGFKDGDLSGNILSLYCTFYDVPVDSILARLELLDSEEAVCYFKSGGIDKNQDWPLKASFAYYDRLLGRAYSESLEVFTERPVYLENMQVEMIRISTDR